MSVTITGIPAGVTFNHGTLSPDGKTLTLTPAQLAGLTLISDGETQHFNLTVTATTVDGGNTTSAASTTATLHVDVTPVADAPTLAVSNASGNEDHAIALDIAPALAEADADAVVASVTITGIPAGVTFNHGALSLDGKALTLTPAQLAGLTLISDGETQHFDLTVTATTIDGGDAATAASVSKTLHVDVTPVADAPVLTVPTTSVVSGNEDSPIALGIHAALGEADADAVLTVTITGLPPGVTLSNANGDTLTISPSGSITLAAAQLAGLALTGDNESQHFDLSVTAKTVDGGDAATAVSVTKNLHVDVAAIADAPVLTVPAPLTTTFDLSAGETIVSVSGINDAGTIVGTFRDGTNLQHGFVLSGGVTTQIADVGTLFTKVNGINNADAIVGTFDSPVPGGFGLPDIRGGFLLDPGSVAKQVDVPPGTINTLVFDANGINDSGEIVGTLNNTLSGHLHGFVTVAGKFFTTIDVPDSAATEVNGVNNAGDIVGTFVDAHGAVHGFLLLAGATTPTAIDVPGAIKTEAMGINSAGEIVGFFTDQQGHVHAFVDHGGTFNTVDPAGATFAEALGINDSGEIVGFFQDATGQHGFETTAPTVTAKQDMPTALGISAALAPIDSDSVLTVTISGLPSGVTLSDANGDTLTISPTGSITLTPAQLAGLALTSDGTVQHFDLAVTAATNEGDQTTAGLHVDVTLATDASQALLASTASFESLAGSAGVTGASTADSFALASNVLNSTSIPTITDFHTNNEVIDLSALLDAKFGAGSVPATAGNFVQVKEDASGNSATLSINLSGTAGGTFVAAAHLGGVHAGDVVTAVLDHAHTTAQLTAHA